MPTRFARPPLSLAAAVWCAVYSTRGVRMRCTDDPVAHSLHGRTEVRGLGRCAMFATLCTLRRRERPINVLQRCVVVPHLGLSIRRYLRRGVTFDARANVHLLNVVRSTAHTKRVWIGRAKRMKPL